MGWPLAVEVNGVFGDHHSRRRGARFPGPGIDIEPRKIAAVHDCADAMPAPEQVAGGPQIDGQFINLAGLEQRRPVIGFAVARPLNTVADEHRSAIREDIGEPNHEIGIHGARRYEQVRDYRTGDFEVRLERFGGERQAAVLDLSLIARACLGIQFVPAQGVTGTLRGKRIERGATDALDRVGGVVNESRRRSIRWSRCPRKAAVIQRARGAASVGIEIELPVNDGLRRPLVGSAPTVQSHDEIPHGRAAIEIRGLVLQRVIEPPQHFALVIEERLGAEINLAGSLPVWIRIGSRTVHPRADGQAVPPPRLSRLRGIAHAGEVAQAAAQEKVEPRCQMVSGHGERPVELGHVELLPVGLVLLAKKVILDPVERIGKQWILRQRPEAEEFHLPAQGHAFQLCSAIPKGLHRVARRPQEHEAELEGAAAINPFVAQTARRLASEHGPKMRPRTAGMQVLSESGKRTAESADLSVTPFLLRQPLDGVESILLLSPRFFAERIPQPFRSEAPSCILNRYDISVCSQECGSSDADHHGLVFAVWRTFQQNRISARLWWKVQVRREAGPVTHGDGHIAPDGIASGFNWLGRYEVGFEVRRNEHAGMAASRTMVCRRYKRVKVNDRTDTSE